jgi:aminoglycoside 6'-N-acetyltransferase
VDVATGELTTVRPATDDDAELLAGWHGDPDVARYWDDETFTVEEMSERLRRPDVEAYVVEEQGEPVGYVQAWRDGDDAGLDMFLIPSARGRGLGPDAVRALAQQLVEERGWPSLTVDPYVWNAAAVHAWQRAGFRPIGVRPPDDEHTAHWLLMELDR